MLKLIKNSETWELVTEVGRLRVALGEFTRRTLEGFCAWLEGTWRTFPASNLEELGGTRIGIRVDVEADQKVVLGFCEDSFVVELGPMDSYKLQDLAKEVRKGMK